MKRKNVVSLIVIVAIVAVAVFFAGCVEPAPPPTPPTETSPPTPPTETSPPTPPTETPTGEPDLSILPIDVTTSPMGEHLIEVTAEVYNGGTAATADNFDVILNWNYVTDDPWLESSGSNVIVWSAYLGPGKSMNYTHPTVFVAGNPGLYAIEVIADPDDRIRESNENNNRYGPITKILG
jgi:archaellum component FlaF (FlaF/FlaG flagellin family)